MRRVVLGTLPQKYIQPRWWPMAFRLRLGVHCNRSYNSEGISTKGPKNLQQRRPNSQMATMVQSASSMATNRLLRHSSIWKNLWDLWGGMAMRSPVHRCFRRSNKTKMGWSAGWPTCRSDLEHHCRTTILAERGVDLFVADGQHCDILHSHVLAQSLCPCLCPRPEP